MKIDVFTRETCTQGDFIIVIVVMNVPTNLELIFVQNSPINVSTIFIPAPSSTYAI